jgi:hypothetical protein
VDVHQRHQVVGLAAVCLAALFVSCAAALDETCAGPTGCRKGMNSCESLLRGGRQDKDGLVHFRIAYDYDVDPEQKEAFKAGMQMWNKYSKETGFEFEDAETNQYDFRLQKGAPRHLQAKDRDELETKQCATYESLGSYIWYSPKGMELVIQKAATKAAGVKAAASAYAHELGHALNVCHKPESCLMRAGDSKEFCHVVAAKLPDDIPQDDRRDASICGRGARAQARDEDILLAVVKLLKDLLQLMRLIPFMPPVGA